MTRNQCGLDNPLWIMDMGMGYICDSGDNALVPTFYHLDNLLALMHIHESSPSVLDSIHTTRTVAFKIESMF